MANFGISVEVVLKNEGGYVDDPNDHGGATKYGISQRSFPDIDIKDLTVTQACDFYQKQYWLFQGIESQAVADKLLDSYVLTEHHAIKIAQGIVKVAQDGLYGQATETAINSVPPAMFLMGMRIGLAAHYSAIANADPTQKKFLAGWLRRAAQ